MSLEMHTELLWLCRNDEPVHLRTRSGFEVRGARITSVDKKTVLVEYRLRQRIGERPTFVRCEMRIAIDSLEVVGREAGVARWWT